MNANEPYALSLRDIRLTFMQGGVELEVLRGVHLDVRAGEFVALVGPSGAGKSSLLHIAGLLETPQSGEVTIAGLQASRLDDRARTRLRRANIGFVYQLHHLLPEFSATENVAMPLRIAGAARPAAEAQANRLLENLGMGHRLTHRPAQLSGGEQQRVAVARAFANRPRLLLADEPTGNLDPRTAGVVFREFLRLARIEQVAGLVATHSLELASWMDRVVLLHDGLLHDGADLVRRGGTL
jgi:lipoprotein-releasing system ATP-binding protein